MKDNKIQKERYVMGLFGILRNKEKVFKWKVVYRNSKMEIKSVVMMGKDENVILAKVNRCFKKAEYIGMCKVQ